MLAKKGLAMVAKAICVRIRTTVGAANEDWVALARYRIAGTMRRCIAGGLRRTAHVSTLMGGS